MVFVYIGDNFIVDKQNALNNKSEWNKREGMLNGLTIVFLNAAVQSIYSHIYFLRSFIIAIFALMERSLRSIKGMKTKKNVPFDD